MNKEFVPYDIALEMKNLGFDEYCFGRYNVPGDFILSGCYSDSPLVSILVKQNDICKAHTLTSTFSQYFRWFRENDIISEALVVLEKPKRKWYKVFFQFLTIGFYQAPWEYKVKRKK